MVEVINVSKIYPGAKNYAVKNISFNVNNGEVFGLLGHNGAGKTTLIRMLTTLYEPTEGEIFINKYNTRTDKIKIKKIIGIVFENPILYEELTGEENIVYFGKLFGLSSTTLKEKLNTLYKELEIDFQEKKVEKYSKGMKQKIAIARALISDPQIIFLDEPTSGLDIITRKQIRTYIENLKKQNKCIIMTSHIAEDIEKLCDKVLIISKGKMIDSGTPFNLIKKYNKTNFEDTFIEIINSKNT